MKRLVVVGNGMAGMACVEQILKYAPSLDDARDAPSASRRAAFRITVFGDETHVNYNRIMLSSVLAGEKSADDIVLNSVEWYQRHNIDLRVGVRIVDVDADAKTVTGSDGSVTPYDRLLLATGSSAWLPAIEGLNKDGVFVFRTLDDTRALLERAGPGVKAVVTGQDVPGLFMGKVLRDMPVLCWDRVRYIGDRVGAVGAETPDAAEEALLRIDVD